ncbi:MAG: BamA/TamA family outer membrane protein [Rhodothermaceae bacterium]
MTKIKSLVIAVLLSAVSYAQTNSETITVVPGEEYEANIFTRYFLGSHWRDLWITPVKVQVLNLDTFAGGLTPIRKGGGMATKSLRFKGNDGRFWKFRSINKDPTKILPEVFRPTPIADVIRDQTSSSNPMAPLVVVPLLKAVGVLQAAPKLVWLPDDPKLGKYREDFGNILGMIEEHPDEKGAGFENAEKVMGTFKLLHRLEEKRSERICAEEFLKARLVDIFLGDWDRHTDQWRWAKYTVDGVEEWHPIPRDRDQAFARWDGLFPRIAAYMIPQFTHFDDDYPQIEDISWSGRFLDRRILTRVTKEKWDSITVHIKNQLTDEVITNAVQQLPPEHYEKVCVELRNSLINRRDNIEEISHEYYELVNKYINVYASNKNDYLEINRLDEKRTEIKLYRYDIKKDAPKGEPYFYKMVDNSLTRQIRAYLLDGKDKTVVTGTVESGPLLRAVGGDGKDTFVDKSLVKGYFLDVLPIPQAEGANMFYDSGNKTSVVYGSGSSLDRSEVPKPKDDFERYEPQQRDRGHDWLAQPEIGYSSDNGFVIGGGPKIFSYDFRMSPFAYKQTFTAAYTTKAKNYRIKYEGVFYNLIKNAEIKFDVMHSEMAFTKYFGYGNTTTYDRFAEDNNYYRLEQEMFLFAATYRRKISKFSYTDFGIRYQNTESNLDNPEIIQSFRDHNTGLGNYKQLAFWLSCDFDTRDNQANPQSGMYTKMMLTGSPDLFEKEHKFLKLGVDLRYYRKIKLLTDNVIAVRAGGQKIWGDFPFFEAAFLGGAHNLRGFSTERFTGDASVFGQAELRSELFDFKLIVPGKFGTTVFGETGRVYAKGEDSDKWHPSIGAGIWFAFIEHKYTISLNIATSQDRNSWHMTMGMGF